MDAGASRDLAGSADAVSTRNAKNIGFNFFNLASRNFYLELVSHDVNHPLIRCPAKETRELRF